jgi:hypothetical protein
LSWADLRCAEIDRSAKCWGISGSGAALQRWLIAIHRNGFPPVTGNTAPLM